MPRLEFTFDLSMREWQRRVAEFALTCAGSYAPDETARLREFAGLLRTCPDALGAGLATPDPARFEALLSAGAGSTAVLQLFDGAEAGYLLSRGGGGPHLASVVLPGAAEEVSAGGDTVALALVGALALALAEHAPRGAPLPVQRTADGLLLN